MKVIDRTVEPELIVRETAPTFFVGNPQNPEEAGIEFSYGGTAMLLQPGVSEVEDFLAHHVVGKFSSYKLGLFQSKQEAEAYVDKVRRGE